jgi:hypothetical protein
MGVMPSVFEFVLIIAGVLLVLRFVPPLRWLMYPAAVIAFVLGIAAGSILWVLGGAAVFGICYVLGKWQWGAYDRFETHGGLCPECHGTGKVSDPFARVMNTCTTCGGQGSR